MNCFNKTEGAIPPCRPGRFLISQLKVINEMSFMVNFTYKPKPIHVHVPLNLINNQRTSAVALMHADWLTRLTLLGTRQTLRRFLFGGCSVQMGFVAFPKNIFNCRVIYPYEIQMADFYINRF